MGFFDWLFLGRKPKKLRIGLALGSGGAKGFAHLGALKAFEENGIEFSVFAGTSIGSIVGAFLAEGYSSTDIFELLKNMDLGDLKNLFMMSIDSSSVCKIIDREIGYKNIEELNKPFAAIATDLLTGKEKVFEHGNVAKALCASSAIPPVFKPVEIDGVKYIDGAFTSSVPADVVRKLGADYVIGIDLSTHEQKSGVVKKIFPSYQSDIKEPWQKGYEFSDIMIKPNLKGYSAYSVSSGADMYDIGYNAAMEVMSKIISDIKVISRKRK